MMFKRRSPSRKSADKGYPRGAPGKRVYAIGDVHGRYDLLCDLLGKIEQHNAQRSRAKCNVIMLGDLIDRGSQSREVIELFLRRRPSFADFHFVKGNHEEAIVRGLSGESNLLSNWLHHGGYETAESYGIDRSVLIGQPDFTLEHILYSAIPESHLRFMEKFFDSIRFGDYLFVHAGVRPGVPIQQQSDKDLRWIRHEFLNSSEDFGAMIVHGHTVTDTVDIKPNRIGLDTGAYSTGILSALWIEESETGVLQAVGERDDSYELHKV